QIGDDLHVLVPRAVPVDGVAPKLPEPTLSASAAAAMAKADHTAMLGPAPDPNAPPPKPKPPAPVEVVPGIKPELRPAAGAIAPTASAPAPPAPVPPAPDKPVEPVEKILGPAPDPHARPITKPAPADKLVEPEAACERPSDKPGDKLADHEPDTDKPAEPHATRPRTDHLGRVLAPPVDDLWSKIALYAVLGLGAAGVGVWMLKRRRLNIPPNVEIAILAQRSLGGRARVVWLGAGDHELLIAVTPQAVNVLGQWPRGAASAAAAAPVPAPGDDSFAGQMSYAMGPMSMYAAAAAPSQPVPVQVPPPAAPRRRATSQAAPAEPPARAVTTEYFDEAGDYDEHAAEGPPVSREPRPSRPAIVLPPVPAAIAAEARLRRDSQFQRPVTQPVTQPEPADADKPVSPAVNGILKLRGRTSQAPVVEPAREADADADDAAEVELIDDGGAKPGAAIDREADQAWIKDILAAGGGAP
ncbi:MAG TPA: flagellar biosynthetic protein FliO, partial [Kofleriaceae bacterium]